MGTIHVVPDVFFARPHDLYRAIDLLRDLRGARDTVAFQTTTEAATDQMIVHHDLV